MKSMTHARVRGEFADDNDHLVDVVVFWTFMWSQLLVEVLSANKENSNEYSVVSKH